MKKIINIAHRGFTRNFPDNTLESFRAALELGVDGVEFDVQETADGAFFIFHDDDAAGKPIATMTSDEMHEIRVKDKYLVPTLQQTLELLGHAPILIVELKQVRSLDKFLKILRSYADVTRTVIVSFSKELIARMADLAPDIMRAVITNTGVKNADAITQSTHSMAIGMACRDLNNDVISRLHKDGTMVFVWDCTDADTVHRALKFDIDGVISDVPDVVKQEAQNSGG
ncbi:MAG: glycerophosphodiester phosphodiesterase [Chloroflexi bacterium]|nr:glycerophosphodiester phosphodiesterase [Chloroflexota bacterium]